MNLNDKPDALDEDLLKAYDKGILPIYLFYLHKNITSKKFTTDNFLEEL